MQNMYKLSSQDRCQGVGGADVHAQERSRLGLVHAGRALVLSVGVLALASFSPVRAQAPVSGPETAGPLQTVPSVDWVRYMGTWHEIAKYPNRFQRHCVGETSAVYSLQPDGTVQVRNRCRREDGRMDEALGVARRVGGEQSARAQVRFAPDWLAWLPMVWGNYWVVALDPQYQWVVVSEPGREYLWVLARTPSLAPAVMSAVEGQLKQLGFDLARLAHSQVRLP